MKINKKKARALLREVVAESGTDYAVEDCRYVRDGAPACIVGNAIWRVLGDDFARIEADDSVAQLRSESINGDNVYGDFFPAYMETTFGLTMTKGAMRVWGEAQERQDMGETWGQALEAAEEAYNHGT